MKKYNFFAGPAILPQQVIKQASESALSFGDMGLSILEISHRSSQFEAVMEEAEASTRTLLGIPEDYAVLFLTGGASSQFYMIAMNLFGDSDRIGYVDTGTWSTKAIKEAKKFANVEVTASSEDKGFNYVPKGYEIDSGLKYLHVTSNNTIRGTEMFSYPDCDVPLICDMSSDIFSQKFPIEKFDLIYAGAQKNLGPAGVTLVIVKKSILGKVERDLPTMLDYQTHINKGSMFNTPPAFPIYVSMLTMRWIKELGGVEAMEKRNLEKATLLYDAIDSSDLFYAPVVVEDRSRMNVVFKLNDESLTDSFLKKADRKGIMGIKGHRSVGGLRASIYNAMDLEGVKVLVDTIEEFSRQPA